MGHFQIPVSWYRDETMLHLMDKNPASIGVYVMMISWCSDNKSYGDIPYVDFRYVLDGEDEELQALIDAGLITKTEKIRLNRPVYHIIPWSLGGEDTMENLQTMCRSCNSRKGNRVDVVQGG